MLEKTLTPILRSFALATCLGVFAVGCAPDTDSSDASDPAGESLTNDEEKTTPQEQPMTEQAEVTTGPLQFTMKDISGNEIPLKQYKGKVLLMVNTASKCGLTPQYEGLQTLHEKYAEQGLSILGFPANEFGNQEPGTNEQIAQFCEKNYGVEFDMFSKIVVKGEDMHPLYAYLTQLDAKPKGAGDVSWNFEKFLIGRDGQVVARFNPRVKPSDPKLVEAIEAELAK